MNERPVEVSVVLPSYNGAQTIGTQLEALARQQWAGRWELIYVDNGSTDGSGAIVERFRHRLPGLRVVDARDGRGPAYALNCGVLESAAESIVFCNDDDEVAPGWLAAMAEALRSDELVAGCLEHERLNEPWLLDVRGRPQEDRLPEWGFLPYLPFAFGATLGVRRSLHESIGGFDEELNPSAEDMDYCWRLQLAGFRIRFVPDAVTHYRMRGDLRSLWKQAHGYGIGNVLAFKKHLRLGLEPAPHPWRKGIRAWLGLCKRLPLALSKPRFALLVWHVGLRTGMLRGSIKHRVVFL
jgi:GT2 family glycosyltransferase